LNCGNTFSSYSFFTVRNSVEHIFILTIILLHFFYSNLHFNIRFVYVGHCTICNGYFNIVTVWLPMLESWHIRCDVLTCGRLWEWVTGSGL